MRHPAGVQVHHVQLPEIGMNNEKVHPIALLAHQMWEQQQKVDEAKAEMNRQIEKMRAIALQLRDGCWKGENTVPCKEWIDAGNGLIFFIEHSDDWHSIEHEKDVKLLKPQSLEAIAQRSIGDLDEYEIF
jgi:hypothetical protein